MKVTYNWLKDFIDLKLKPEVLAQKLTMAGLEVTSLAKSGDDWVYEMEITPNRPDCLSVLGVAREIAAATGSKLKTKAKKTKSSKAKPSDFSIKVQDKKSCPLYTARLITGISVKPSPAWMQKRLIAVGLRPVNNIVDITNYILMETGQPLHAFDFDKLCDKTIIVRRAKNGEKMVSIDQTEIKLDPSVLVIADGRRPVAAAGIMGGIDTEVGPGTKNILLESAYFDTIITRRAARNLGLSSESSYRFERGVDLLGVERASKKASDLICELSGGQDQGLKTQPNQIKLNPRKVKIDTDRINKILGTNIEAKKIKKILDTLECSAKLQAKTKIIATIPSFRQDIKEEADVAEEIARCFSYDNILSSLPYIKGRDMKAEETELVAKIRNILIRLGLNETITLSLINRNLLDNLNLDSDEAITVINPLSRDQEVLRPTLLASMMECISRNIKYNIKDIKIFEISHAFSDVAEPTIISIALSGEKSFGWQEKNRGKLDFFDLKGAVGALLLELGIKDFLVDKFDQPYFSNQASANLIVNNTVVGILGKADNSVLGKWDISKRDVFLAEIYLDKLWNFINLSRSYETLNRFPKVSRNLSIAVSKDMRFSQIKKCIEKNASELLQNIALVEQYKGAHIEKGSRGLVLLLVYQTKTHTLTDEEVNSLHSKICDGLIRELGVKIR